MMSPFLIFSQYVCMQYMAITNEIYTHAESAYVCESHYLRNASFFSLAHSSFYKLFFVRCTTILLIVSVLQDSK